MLMFCICLLCSFVDCLVKWDALPNRNNFPLMFYGLVGVDYFEVTLVSCFPDIDGILSV